MAEALSLDAILRAIAEDERAAQKPRAHSGPVVREVPQYRCRTYTLNLEILNYQKAPSHDANGKPLTFWEASPDKWRHRVLEHLMCDQKVNRMCDFCDSCLRRVIEWEKLYHAAQKARRQKLAQDSGGNSGSPEK